MYRKAQQELQKQSNKYEIHYTDLAAEPRFAVLVISRFLTCKSTAFLVSSFTNIKIKAKETIRTTRLQMVFEELWKRKVKQKMQQAWNHILMNEVWNKKLPSKHFIRGIPQQQGLRALHFFYTLKTLHLHKAMRCLKIYRKNFNKQKSLNNIVYLNRIYYLRCFITKLKSRFLAQRLYYKVSGQLAYLFNNVKINTGRYLLYQLSLNAQHNSSQPEVVRSQPNFITAVEKKVHISIQNLKQEIKQLGIKATHAKIQLEKILKQNEQQLAKRQKQVQINQKEAQNLENETKYLNNELSMAHSCNQQRANIKQKIRVQVGTLHDIYKTLKEDDKKSAGASHTDENGIHRNMLRMAKSAKNLLSVKDKEPDLGAILNKLLALVGKLKIQDELPASHLREYMKLKRSLRNYQQTPKPPPQLQSLLQLNSQCQRICSGLIMYLLSKRRAEELGQGLKQWL